ncbi:MAG: DsrE family protein [Sulfuricaulis sp.]|uniref:DsrE family protein n=1 Tax=Sulfuricaulis sp. TaxID=2003553 RepID=UPI003C436857
MKKLIALSVMALLSLGLGAGAAYAEDYGKQKVVYHVNVDDEKQLKATLGNIQNHINAVGKENIDLRVVMHGPGVQLLQIANKNPDFQDKISNLKRQGVHFNVCNNTLVGKKIDYKTDLYDVSKEDIVPSGVAELAALQSKGFSYVKP